MRLLEGRRRVSWSCWGWERGEGGTSGIITSQDSQQRSTFLGRIDDGNNGSDTRNRKDGRLGQLSEKRVKTIFESEICNSFSRRIAAQTGWNGSDRIQEEV